MITYIFVAFFILSAKIISFQTSISVPKLGLSRIVNGKDAQLGDFPYQLSLRRNSVHICGAAVLSKNWAITAAHCVYGYQKPSHIFSLRAGSIKRTSGGIIIEVDSIQLHPSYNPETISFDVALLQAGKHEILGDFIAPISLIELNIEITEGTSALVSGWGHFDTLEKKLSADLKFTNVITHDQKNCMEQLKMYGEVSKV